MHSSTLLEEIISEVKLHNPNATPEEISEGIAAVLDKEILPEILRNVSLPEFPSYRSIAIAEGRGVRGKRKKAIMKSPELVGRRRAIQHVEDIRIELGWDGGDDLMPKAYIADSASLYYLPKADLPLVQEELDRQLGKDSNLKRDPQPTEKETVNGPFQKFPKQPEMRDLIVLSETAQRKIVSEPIFEKLFKNIELQLRTLIATRELRTEIDVACKSDIEISSWKKCVFEVHPPPELNFDERMKISTIFDIAIRKEIKELTKNADPSTIEYLQSLNRSLFIHIDL
jgi:hypothetical protein